MDGLTPQQVGAPLLAQVQQKQPTPQEILAQIGQRAAANIERQKAEEQTTRDRISQLREKSGKGINLTPFAVAVDAMTGSNYAPAANAMFQQQRQPEIEASRLEELLRKQQNAISDDEINLLRAQYQQAKGSGDMSFAEKEALKLKNKKDVLGTMFDFNKRLKLLGQESKKDKPTKAQDAVDKAFAKDYNDFVLQGGMAVSETNLNALENVSNALGSYAEDGSFVPGKNNLTGPAISLMPDILRSRAAAASRDIQDQVEKVVQQDLKKTLGAQFTEKEATRLIERSYNPSLPEEMNKRRINDLVQQTRKIIAAKKAAAQYYQQNGTMAGYNGIVPMGEMTAEDVEQFGKQEGQGAKSVPKVGDVVDGYKFKGGMPGDPSNWEKM